MYKLFIQVPTEWAPFVGILIEVIYIYIYIYRVIQSVENNIEMNLLYSYDLSVDPLLLGLFNNLNGS